MTVKAKQVAGVTSAVAIVVVVLSALHLAALARVSLAETASRGEMLAKTIYQRAFGVVENTGEAYQVLREDSGIRAILESAIAYSKNVTYAAIVDPADVAVAHSSAANEGQPLPRQPSLLELQEAGILRQLRAIYSDETFEVSQPLLLGDRQFGTIRIGVSTLLVRSELQRAFREASQTALLALVVATIGAMLLSQWMLRPIHVIKSGLSRLGRGEFGVRLDLPAGDEFKELGTSFEAISAQLSAMRDRPAGSPVGLDSVVASLEDAVAVFGPQGRVIFANPAMRAMLPALERDRDIGDALPAGHPVRTLVGQTLVNQRGQGPTSASLPQAEGGEPVERLMMTHLLEDQERRPIGAMLVARNVGYLSRVQSTLAYSQKLAALGRLMAGVAHEVKNPLNAMTIHLELLKNKLARQPDAGGAVISHVDVITQEIKRLDEVMLGFLKFARPDELRLQPIPAASLIDEVVRIVEPEAQKTGVVVRADCPRELPDVNCDPNMLQQVLLNLAINACQAMPQGGTLRLSCRAADDRRIVVDVEDTGVGIPPENLAKIFDLYFTTKEKGSGIGLSMVYRIIQLHDGEVEVESTPGSGTRFRLLLPQA